MKFIADNKKTRDQWNEAIVNTQKIMIFRKNSNILMELSIHRNTHDSVSDSDTTPQF
jgi:hypothetical protein